MSFDADTLSFLALQLIWRLLNNQANLFSNMLVTLLNNHLSREKIRTDLEF
jgi:hypothetical protein